MQSLLQLNTAKLQLPLHVLLINSSRKAFELSVLLLTSNIRRNLSESYCHQTMSSHNFEPQNVWLSVTSHNHIILTTNVWLSETEAKAQ